MVEIYAIRTVPEEEFGEYRDRFLQVLPAGSRAAVLKYRMALDQQRSLLGEILVRSRLSASMGIPAGKLVMKRAEKGKPELEGGRGVHFNLSHSGEWVVVAIANRDVGIDVERIRPPQYRIAERFFSETELTELNKLDGREKMHYFFDLWTLKESYLKLLGKGLTQSLGSFTVSRERGAHRLMVNGKPVNDVHFRQYPIDPGYKLSVCSFSGEFSSEVEHMTMDRLI